MCTCKYYMVVPDFMILWPGDQRGKCLNGYLPCGIFKATWILRRPFLNQFRYSIGVSG